MPTTRTQSGTLIELGPLAQDLPFMIRNTRALLIPVSDRIRAELGIQPGVIGVLSLIWLNPGISQNDLAECLALKKSAITKVVKLLEAEGLVARERVSSDRRMNALTLTAAGQGLIAAVRRLTNAMHDRIFDGIAQADSDTFFRVLGQVVENLGAEAAG